MLFGWPLAPALSNRAHTFFLRRASPLATTPSGAQQQLLHPLESKLQSQIRSNLKIRQGHLLLVSVSGGADSVALLRLLLALQPQEKLNLHVIHFNHGLRPEADREEEFVRSIAKNYSLPFHVRRLPQGWADSSVATGIQSRTRNWRRAESQELLQKLSYSNIADDEDTASEIAEGVGQEQTTRKYAGASVALAHHADDQIETILLKLLRGCHISNLRGMKWQQGCFIRPLLHMKKSQLMGYLTDIDQTWMEDPSNSDTKYKRNRVRLQLIPLLEELSEEALDSRIFAMEEQSAWLREWLDSESGTFLSSEEDVSAKPWEIRVAEWLALPKLVGDEVMHKMVREGSCDEAGIAHDSLERLRRQIVHGKKCNFFFELPGGWGVERAGRVLRICSTPHRRK